MRFANISLFHLNVALPHALNDTQSLFKWLLDYGRVELFVMSSVQEDVNVDKCKKK